MGSAFAGWIVCPFCGSDGADIHYVEPGDSYVKCDDCGAREG